MIFVYYDDEATGEHDFVTVDKFISYLLEASTLYPELSPQVDSLIKDLNDHNWLGAWLLAKSIEINTVFIEGERVG